MKPRQTTESAARKPSPATAWDVALFAACPWCRAKAGRACSRTDTGGQVAPHRQRFALAVREVVDAAPRGFAAAYRREARDPAQPSVLADILLLVGYEASPATLAAWSLRQRVEALVYAANVHARAGDVPGPHCPRPAWLPEPWQGGWRDGPEHVRADLRGAFAGPAPTPLTATAATSEAFRG